MDFTVADDDTRNTIITELQNLALKKYPDVLIDTTKQNKLLSTQLKEYSERAQTLNQEFSERYAVTGPENPLPFFAVNQDILLFLFTFTYVFFILVSAFYTYRITSSASKGSFIILLGGIAYLLMFGFLLQFG